MFTHGNLWPQADLLLPVVRRLERSLQRSSVGYGLLCNGVIRIGVWINDGERLDWYSRRYHRLGEPAHWTPLPKPPSE